ncbi:MAG TPA: hypothetical protein VLY86_00405 [Methanothrix sp.]|nr:hypothetical protein [Methanothrix sp.]
MIPEEFDNVLERTASRAMNAMEDIISTMEQAAKEVALGRDLKEIEVGDLQIYLASGEGNREAAVISVMDFHEYIRLLADAASEEGLDLEKAAELEVMMPEAEFSADMVTGGFGDFKGFSVELRNDLLEQLLETVQNCLQERGLTVACVRDDEVIFHLPLRRRGRLLGSKMDSCS